MWRVALAIVASIVVSAAAPVPAAPVPSEVPARCAATKGGQTIARTDDCYDVCFHLCIAKGGTNAACEVECSAGPPCRK